MQKRGKRAGTAAGGDGGGEVVAQQRGTAKEERGVICTGGGGGDADLCEREGEGWRDSRRRRGRGDGGLTVGSSGGLTL